MCNITALPVLCWCIRFAKSSLHLHVFVMINAVPTISLMLAIRILLT